MKYFILKLILKSFYRMYRLRKSGRDSLSVYLSTRLI